LEQQVTAASSGVEVRQMVPATEGVIRRMVPVFFGGGLQISSWLEE
jgi:hypothetical protein